MGDLFRRFWLPALVPSELPHPDSDPVRLRLLGEDLIAFRDTNGQVGIIQNNCPHRGASLFFGRNEESGLRCVYHGWKFDTAHDGARPVHYLGPGFLVTLGLKKAPSDRLKELLRIVDWSTAPFGSTEDLLLTYGVSGVDHTLDDTGRPVATQRTSPDVDAVGWKYISQRPQVMTWPAWPEYAKVAYDFEPARDRLRPAGQRLASRWRESDTNRAPPRAHCVTPSSRRPAASRLIAWSETCATATCTS